MKAQTDDQKIILELEKDRQYAISLHDEIKLKDLLDDSYYGVTATGKVVNKSEQLEIYKSTNPYVTFTSEGVSVTSVEASAIVTGTLVGKTKSGSVVGETRYLIIYLKSANQWKIKMAQETVVMK